MGRNVMNYGQPQTDEKEGSLMDYRSDDRSGLTRRALATLISNTDADLLRLCLRDWDARRCPMREILSGDRRK